MFPLVLVIDVDDKYLLASTLSESEKTLLPDPSPNETIGFIIIALVYLYKENMTRTNLDLFMQKVGLPEDNADLVTVLIKQGYLQKQKVEDQEFIKIGPRTTMQYPQETFISFVLKVW